MSLGEVMRERRESLEMTQDQVADQAGISKPYLSNIETGKAKNPPSDGVLKSLERVLKFETGQLLKLAHLMRTPKDVLQDHDLLETQVQRLRGVLKELVAGSKVGEEDLAAALGKNLSGQNVRQISAGAAVPIINRVAAGYPSHFTDLDYPPSVADEYIRCPDVHDPQAFAARVVGDSMEPSYHEGDIVIFSPNTPARGGHDCFVRFEGDAAATFKRCYMDDEQTIRLQPLNNRYPSTTHPRDQITGLWPVVFRIERIR